MVNEQLLALLVILGVINLLRSTRLFMPLAVSTNTLLISAGLMLTAYQLTGYILYS